jgi:formiminotetrahydrofolate cyclodeaminase
MDFLDEIAAYSPVPAGGAAAAYTATLGLALLYKVLLFELNRKELNPAPQATLRVAQKEIERLFLDLKKVVREDPQCYVRFSRDSKSGDRSQGKTAFLDIMTCSMVVMEKCYEGLEWVRQLGNLSSVKLAPHLRVAAELLAASAAATAHVVRENVAAIKSPEKQVRYLENLQTVYEECMTKKKEVMESIHSEAH